MRRAAPHNDRGRCADCRRTRPVYRATRMAGGSYRQGNRRYRSSICGECALGGLSYAPIHAGATGSGGWHVSGLEDIVASLGTVEAAEVLDRFRERRARRRAADEQRRAEATP